MDLSNVERFLFQKAKKLDIELVYLFGSQAQANTGLLSDVDLALLFSKVPTPAERYNLAYQFAKQLDPHRIDLIVLNQAPIELRYNVIGTGQVIFEIDRSTRIEFEANTLSNYFDFLPVLRHQRQAMLDEGKRSYDARVQRYRAALRTTQRMLGQIRTT